MIRCQSQKQLSLADFGWPFQTDMDAHNRWVVMSKCIPWDALAEGYYRGLDNRQGRPAKDARLVIGAVIIKHKFNLSDRETVLQIQENPYLQYFVGLTSYQMEEPFAPSLFVEIRKRMKQEVFEVFHEAIIDALENAQEGEKQTHRGRHQSATAEQSREQDDDHPPPDSGTTKKEEDVKHQGKLILDATVAPQAIRYPTDLGLLNEAREFSEKIIDALYPWTEMEKKPRTYRVKACQAYLALVKSYSQIWCMAASAVSCS